MVDLYLLKSISYAVFCPFATISATIGYSDRSNFNGNFPRFSASSTDCDRGDFWFRDGLIWFSIFI